MQLFEYCTNCGADFADTLMLRRTGCNECGRKKFRTGTDIEIAAYRAALNPQPRYQFHDNTHLTRKGGTQ